MQPILYSTLFVMFCVLMQCDGICDQGIYAYGVKDKEKNYIVDLHNKLRLLIANGELPGQPRGVNLKRVTWDDHLAQKAQNIANNCVYGHFPVKDSRWPNVGQNIGAGGPNRIQEANWEPRIMQWWNEYQNYNFPDQSTNTTGHYTQMAWHHTTHIGCGYTLYPQQDPQYKYREMYICHYGPGGNYYRQGPYQTGTSGCENLC